MSLLPILPTHEEQKKTRERKNTMSPMLLLSISKQNYYKTSIET